jgi:hypothetical protein
MGLEEEQMAIRALQLFPAVRLTGSAVQPVSTAWQLLDAKLLLEIVQLHLQGLFLQMRPVVLLAQGQRATLAMLQALAVPESKFHLSNFISMYWHCHQWMVWKQHRLLFSIRGVSVCVWNLRQQHH